MNKPLNAIPAGTDEASAFAKTHVVAINKESGPRFPRVWLDDVEINLTNDDYIKNLIGRKANILIYGPSGDGKTFFTGDVGAHIATGQSWRGRRVRQCLVVYVAAEAGTSILRRFFAWRGQHLSEAREERIPMAIITRGANLLDIGDLELLLIELRAIVAEVGLPLGIVVFDTLSRSIPGGDENAAVDMTRAIAAADQIRDELGASTIYVHHAGKDSAKGARGHSSLFAAADTVISVIERVATVEKSRDGTSGEQFPFNLEVVNLDEDQDGDPITTCLVIPTDTAPQQRRGHQLSGVARVALQSLQETITDHGEAMAESSTIPRGVKAVMLEQWRARFAIRYGSEGDGGKRDGDAVRKAFQRGREALLKTSAICIIDPYCWLVT